jgi:phosphoribosylaminoimidazolecarboxamide formyltransferase/IMP cyclohydrolase
MIGTPRGTDISKFKRAYSKRNEGSFPTELVLRLQKEWDLKYGENPNQQGALYFVSEAAGRNTSTVAELTDLVSVRSDGKGKGGLSLTNAMDVCRAMDNLKWFKDPAVVILKHCVVSGFATAPDGSPLDGLVRTARDCDQRSNFGGSYVTNRPIDAAAVDALFELYVSQKYIVDVIAAPDYEPGVLAKIEKISKNVRLAQFSRIDSLPRFIGDDTHGLVSIKEMPTGRVGIQDVYLTSVKSVDDLITDPKADIKDKDGNVIESPFIQRDPTPQEAKDMLTAWYLNISGARSNGIVLVRNGVLVSMGSGQVERVGAVEQALIKGIHKAFDREGIPYNPLEGITGYKRLRDQPFAGAVCASDAFFPFKDSIETLGNLEVSAIIQPCGSERDGHVIKAANKYQMAMAATGERCFGHW